VDLDGAAYRAVAESTDEVALRELRPIQPDGSATLTTSITPMVPVCDTPGDSPMGMYLSVAG
jgi:hypothetical protein